MDAIFNFEKLNVDINPDAPELAENDHAIKIDLIL